MSTPGRFAPLRTTRGVLSGLTCGVGAVLAHAYAGGGQPSPVGFGVTLLACTLLALALTKRRLDPAALLALTLLGQGLLHTAFHSEAAMVDATLMVSGHALAAVLTVAVASGAERALWRLAARVIAALVPLILTGPALPRLWQRCESRTQAPHQRLLGVAWSTRGPPKRALLLA